MEASCHDYHVQFVELRSLSLISNFDFCHDMRFIKKSRKMQEFVQRPTLATVPINPLYVVHWGMSANRYNAHSKAPLCYVNYHADVNANQRHEALCE